MGFFHKYCFDSEGCGRILVIFLGFIEAMVSILTIIVVVWLVNCSKTKLDCVEDFTALIIILELNNWMTAVLLH